MLFNNTIKWIESFVSMDTELVKGNEIEAEGSSKRAADKLQQEDAKRQRIKEENKSAELKKCLEIIPDNDDVTIEATPLSSKSLTFVDYKNYKEGRKAFSKSSKQMNMFEHHVEDNIWKYQQGTTKVLNWKLFDSCGVYCITTHNMVYYLLVEKMYPFTRNILHQMWNDVSLQVDYKVKIAYDLLRLIRRIKRLHSDIRVTAAQTTSLQTQLIAALGRIDTLKAREPDHIDDLEDADSCS
uniref:Uncharacterized protein n=1 Tax=Tanacetum cinerariifolium TaxID=118510 RepID=A0A6L2KQB2_TANCI|nr:hypothetical protein [Tanacetum cinerariifolium]